MNEFLKCGRKTLLHGSSFTYSELTFVGIRKPRNDALDCASFENRERRLNERIISGFRLQTSFPVLFLFAFLHENGRRRNFSERENADLPVRVGRESGQIFSK